MEKITKYLDLTTTLKDNFGMLCNPFVSLEKDREKVNELVLNFVLKYLASYLGIQATDAEILHQKILEAVSSHDVNTGEKAGEKFRNLLTGSNGDLPGLECLCDLRATSAIVKEIIFADQFSKKPPFIGIDLGTGTGILLASMYIAAQRNKIEEVLGLGLDSQEPAVQNSQKVLERLLPKGSFILQQADITDPNVYDIFCDFPVRMLVSETISLMTPPLKISQEGKVTPILRDEVEKIFLEINEMIDPFPTVLQLALQHVRDLQRKVINGEMFMFPDIFNGRYIPNGENSQISFRTGSDKLVNLSDAGQEFKDYEELGFNSNKGHRWPQSDDQGQAMFNSFFSSDSDLFQKIWNVVSD